MPNQLLRGLGEIPGSWHLRDLEWREAKCEKLHVGTRSKHLGLHKHPITKMFIGIWSIRDLESRTKSEPWSPQSTDILHLMHETGNQCWGKFAKSLTTVLFWGKPIGYLSISLLCAALMHENIHTVAMSAAQLIHSHLVQDKMVW